VFGNGVVKPSLNSVLSGLVYWVEGGGKEETTKKYFVSVCKRISEYPLPYMLCISFNSAVLCILCIYWTNEPNFIISSL
jgi:hypothetical protein